MPSLLVCALLGLAVAVLLDVTRAPGPSVSIVETPVIIVGLERLRRAGSDAGLLSVVSRRAVGTPTAFLDDVIGEVELTGGPTPALADLPSIIVED